MDAAGNLAYSNAAHPPFLLHVRETGKAAIHEEPSHLLGAMPQMPFAERSVRVGPGDTLFVYTDGLTDRRNEAGEFYSVERIARMMEQAGQQDLAVLYDTIFQDVTSFPATEEFKDDIAFVLTRFH